VLAGRTHRAGAPTAKRELPNYQVFDERRYFASGRDAAQSPVVFDVGGTRFAVLICEDAWFDEPAASAKAAGAQVLCVLNASPFHLGKLAEREARMADRARSVAMPLLYSHLTGAQDEVVFDGASFALDVKGRVAARAPMFEEALTLVEIQGDSVSGPIAPVPCVEAQAWAALVTGVRDYLGKNGFPGAIIGLSGGVHRLGAGAGHRGGCAGRRQGAGRHDAVAVHGRHLVDRCARHGRQRLGVRYDEISHRRPMFDAFRTSLAPEFENRYAFEDATEENIQARIRGTLLMALVEQVRFAIVLTTGNKSEMATGYCTLVR
jgi:NAD+ synthase (glutamine-hydrolysing)